MRFRSRFVEYASSDFLLRGRLVLSDFVVPHACLQKSRRIKRRTPFRDKFQLQASPTDDQLFGLNAIASSQAGGAEKQKSPQRERLGCLTLSHSQNQTASGLPRRCWSRREDGMIWKSVDEPATPI